MSAPRVLVIEPSPVHRHQWLLRFTCGHRVSVTSTIKPQAQRYTCGDCWLRFHRDIPYGTRRTGAAL